MTFQELPFLDVFTDASGGNIKTPQKEFLEEGEIPVVDQGQGLIAGFVNDRSRVCNAKPPVIVFGDHTRAIKYVDFEFAMGADGTKVLVPKGESDTKYLYHALNAIEIPAAGYSRHYKFLKETQIPLPPLAEQKRIARILDVADALRAKRRESLAQLDTLLQSTFLDMFGDPVTYTERYDVCELDNVCEKITDGEHGTVGRVESGRRYLMARNVTRGLTIDLSAVSYIAEADHQRIFKRCDPRPGDLLLVCVGATIGKVALVPEMEEFSLARSVSLIKPDRRCLEPYFLLHLFDSDYLQCKLVEQQNVAAQAGLYLSKIRGLEIPVPPSRLQQRFSAIVESVEQQKATQRRHLDELDTLFASLQSRAFNGEL